MFIIILINISSIYIVVLLTVITLPINPLNTELNPICHLLTLLGAHHILHVSRVRVNYYTQQGGHISELRISKLVFFFVTCFDGNEEELRICSLEPSYRVIKENAISS